MRAGIIACTIPMESASHAPVEVAQLVIGYLRSFLSIAYLNKAWHAAACGLADLLFLYDSADKVRPDTPSSGGQCSDSDECLEISFTVHLYVGHAGTLITTVKCDHLTTAGFLVKKVREWHKKHLGRSVAESQVQLIIREKCVQKMTTKLVDLADTHNLGEPLIVTAVVPSGRPADIIDNDHDATGERAV